MKPLATDDPLAPFSPLAREWFRDTYGGPTAAQRDGWRAIAAGQSTLIQAPTGGGKTLAAFYWAINTLMFDAAPETDRRCRVIYISPLKALAVDVERNLRVPLAGLAARARAADTAIHLPTVAVRTGDTPASERARFRRTPSDILITTPESLYLLLTSDARVALRGVRTVIVDEVHALVPTKRGAHLALSLERLEALLPAGVQRIGLSATQRPLDEVARFLGGFASPAASHPAGVRAASAGGRERPVTIVATGERKVLELNVDVPAENMARPPATPPVAEGQAARTPRVSMWNAIHPRLLELVRAHRSTLLFVNSRRGAERLAAALNDLAGEPLVRAHHGSLAREQRVEVEEALKAGQLRGLVATSSLELGIDMGAIDLVIQIEAPPSVAAGLQRAGRGGHQVQATSRAHLFPKFRADLLACAAVTRAMHDGAVESTRYLRSPLDVLAQQVVAMAAMDGWRTDDLFDVIRRAAPFAELAPSSFHGVLDMLSGRYPSDDFAGLRPRLTWNRSAGTVQGRSGARRLAVLNGGTIPDRGLYGVFLAGGAPGSARVGELDEEMVFESQVGETFVLGASTWRILEITHDRVLVAPAPGEPGKIPFWKADAAGRPLEFGQRIGALARELRDLPHAAAAARLVVHHDLDARSADHLLGYLDDQAAVTSVIPDDRTIVIERGRDETGSWRICVLSPIGSRVLAPWAMAVAQRLREARDVHVETMWTDDGFVVRMADTDDPPDVGAFLPASATVEDVVVAQLTATAHFAARFREAAGRALLLPSRRPGQRSPLWQQRKRAGDLLAVASRFPAFPIVLEAMRECLRDDFDIPALAGVLRQIEEGTVRVVTVDTARPSPFAAAVLFGYVANYLYDGDAPLAERRAQALTIDQDQLRALIGDADLRNLLAADDLDDIERDRQRLSPEQAFRSVDDVHDGLLHLGDLSWSEAHARGLRGMRTLVKAAIAERRVVIMAIGDEDRLVPVELAAQYRDACGVRLPAGVPRALRGPVPDAIDELASRFARTHGPFLTHDFATRYALDPDVAAAALERLEERGRLTAGEFRPGGHSREWISPEVLRLARHRSLARLRHEAAPVSGDALGRFLVTWQGVGSARRGPDALLDAIESLQGAAVPASMLESHILPARVADYSPGDLDLLAAAGEVAWAGVERLGQRDGRVAVYLTDGMPHLLPPLLDDEGHVPVAGREHRVLEWLRQSGASFFPSIHDAAGGGYPGETVDALWALVWKGLVTNDGFQALRQAVSPPPRARTAHTKGLPYRSRRVAPPAGEGRWSLIQRPPAHQRAAWATAFTRQLLTRYGVLTREAVLVEQLPGGFAALYPVLRALEDAGQVRRGYFVGDVAATQFATVPAVEMLRDHRRSAAKPVAVLLSAMDPANPYGHLLPWPRHAADVDEVAGRCARAVGAMVVLVDGRLAAFWRTGSDDLTIHLPEDDGERVRVAAALAGVLAGVARGGEGRSGGLLIRTVNGQSIPYFPLDPHLLDAGFVRSALGYHVVRSK